ncbi:unnamed protein product [Meganyctiphanes norvegica]|uniref:Reverse transcriptase domain-containing protein n=1 Tax=Meganyctiphanes norvegica TaxID=48144 RepID=A0AAV2RL12_MEGNR
MDNTLIPITDLGECEPIKVKEMIKQGSVLGSVISAITIDSLTRIMNKQKTWNIGDIKINPLLFQDDIFAANKTKDIQETVNVIQTFQNLKRLQFHEEKSKKSILNGKRDEPIYINGIQIERASSHKYLGKLIEERSIEKEENKERIKKAKAAANDSLNFINRKELKNKRVNVGKKLLQTVVIPTLTFGAETWPQLTGIEKGEMNKIQTQYLNRLLRVPKTTPKCALIKENELMKIEHIANQRKLEYNIDLNNREEWRLEVKARKIQEEKKLKYYNEIEELKVFYNIKENLNEVDPKTAKNTIKKAVLRKK